MLPLRDRIAEAIRTDGPMPVSLYMHMCLHDPVEGYYARGGGLGRDFVTAPETSQVFGELVGLWALHEWRAMGSPAQVHLVELGPGRGLMMADMLRVARSAAEYQAAVRPILVEASPALRQMQAERLRLHHPQFIAALDDLPAGPCIIVGNEFLDCLPIRQYVREGALWWERRIGRQSRNSLPTMMQGPAGKSSNAAMNCG
jgi:NADH dehydrogenase [ubiquinone] 1 alpha subcomplex assembly factor 7